MQSMKSKKGMGMLMYIIIGCVALFCVTAMVGLLGGIGPLGGWQPEKADTMDDAKSLAVVDDSDTVKTDEDKVAVARQYGIEDTTLHLYAYDFYNKGTSIGGTAYLIDANDPEDVLKSGKAAGNPGDVLSMLWVNNTLFHNAWAPEHTIPGSKGDDDIKAFGKKNSTLTISVFNADNDKMSDGCTGSGVNQTVAAGLSYTLSLRLDGQTEAATQDMICVLESSDKTKMDKMVLSGAQLGVTTKDKYGESLNEPSFYTASAAASGTWTFGVESIEGVSKSGTIQLYSKNQQSLAGTTFSIKCYTKEHFIDTNGQHSYGVQNKDGTRQSMALYGFTGCLV